MPRIYEMQNTPSVAEYVGVLKGFGDRITEEHRRIFRAHYHAPNRSATAKQLASLADVAGGWTIVNSRYGKLGHALCDTLGIRPELRPEDTHRWWSVWSRGWSTPDGFIWQMLPKVADALEQLGWVEPTNFILPDEIAPAEPLLEGAICRITVNAYERNSAARRWCIEVHGTTCCICGFNFGKAYGPEAEGYIHVHHVRPLSEIGGEYTIDPVEDLRPVCPNCHAVLHFGGHCRSIEDIRQLLR